MADPSRTTWPAWAPLPVICSVCGKRVTLKQAHRSWFDERTQEGKIWHTSHGPHYTFEKVDPV